MILSLFLYVLFAFLTAVGAALATYFSSKRVGLAVMAAVLTLLAFVGLGAALVYLWQSSASP